MLTNQLAESDDEITCKEYQNLGNIVEKTSLNFLHECLSTCEKIGIEKNTVTKIHQILFQCRLSHLGSSTNENL